MFRTLASAWLTDLLPATCPFCTMAHERGPARVCRWCRQALAGAQTRRCPRCALPAPGGGPCLRCRARASALDGVITLADYAPPLSDAIAGLKFRACTALAGPLAEALAQTVRMHQPSPMWPGLLVPMPLSPARQRERGYNQAALLSRRLARTLAVPQASHALRRSGLAADAHQLGRSRRARTSADLGRFHAEPGLCHGHIALIDDVMTTGATLEAAARALRAAGASRITAWVLARTA
ncbi:MAG: phosphoribosyltransferase family protein [Burkholderiaceae bacterium]